MAVIVPVASKFDDSGIKAAKKAFGGLSKNLKGTLGAIGIATSIAGLASALGQATKAASNDAKGQVLLAQQLRNTASASDAQISSIEASIAQMSVQTAVADDQLRPALASLVRATGDVTSAQDLLSLSLDVSAATGKDLQSVSLAVGKAVSGQTTALFRMIPALKGSDDWMGKLKEQTKGMAEAAGRQDPYMRLKVIFDELQETIGFALLPYLNEVADYFGSAEGQKNLQDFALSITDAVKAIADLGKGMADLAPIADPVFGYLNGLIAAFTGNTQRATEIFQGLFGTMTAETNANRAKNQASASRLAGQRNPASGGLNRVATSISTSSAKASKAAADAAKKAADAAKKAQDKLIADFKANITELAGAFAPLGRISEELGQFEQEAIDSFTAINDAVTKGLKDKALTQAAANFIYDYIKVEKVALQALARQRDVLLAKIAIAKDISRGVVDAVNITGLLTNETKQVTKSVQTLVNGIATTITSTYDEVITGNLADSFKKLVDKTKNFAKNLTALKKLGLNGTLFKQIVDAGAEAGGATAEAIIAGGADTVSELNGLFDDLNQAGSDIAKESTDTFYSLGEGVSNAFIDGLKSQEQALADEISKMVASIEAAFQLMMANLEKLKGNQMSVPASSLDTYEYAQILAGAGNPITNEDIRFANIGQRVGATVNVTVNAGLGTNGKAVGQQITSLLNQYTKANA